MSDERRAARIEVIPDDAWEGELAERYPDVVDPRFGKVDHIMAVHSLDPRGMAAHHALYRSAMSPTPTLRSADRELLAYVVSVLNDCHY